MIGMRFTIEQDLTEIIAGRMAIGSREAVQEGTELVAGTAREKVRSGQKSGRVYTSGPPPLPHQASAPGESPANWTGELLETIAESIGVGEDLMGLAEGSLDGPMGEVNVGAPHGLILEFGSRNMAARPFFIQSVEESAPAFERRLTAAANEAIG